MNVYKTEFYPSVHCEDCNEIIHNYFDCPVCKQKFSSTSISENLLELDVNEERFFSCYFCKSNFKFIEDDLTYGEEISIEHLSNDEFYFLTKAIHLEDFREERENLFEYNTGVALTNGCFDVFHPGHLYLLQAAKKKLLCDFPFKKFKLVVAINSDISVGRLKGNSRPIFTLYDRASMLNALTCVDYLLTFDEVSVYNTIKDIKPDVLFKGGTTDEIIGKEYVESYGGVVYKIPPYKDFSTTKILGEATNNGRNKRTRNC